jgi:ATP-dependent Clp protease protease subunit
MNDTTRALNPVPMVVEQTAGGERADDIDLRLLMSAPSWDRSITTWPTWQAQLLFLESRTPKRHRRISAPLGGSVSAARHHDTMQFIARHQHDLRRTGREHGTVLLAGTKSKRHARRIRRDDSPLPGGFQPGDGHRDPRARDPRRARPPEPHSVHHTG